MVKHVKSDCGDRYCSGCARCDLFVCGVCGTFEGGLPTECPGYMIGADKEDEIYAGKVDFIDGEWKPQKARWMQLQEAAVRQAEERRRSCL
jgi:hypothetical protein